MLLKKVEGGWAPPALKNYGNKSHLQELLAESPELVPGAAGSAAVREFPIPGVGKVDLLCVDIAGTITLVECKLAANADIRRTVVGQIFAYASGLRGMDFDDFAVRFANRSGGPVRDAVQAAASQEVDPATLRAGIERSLTTGNFRLALAVDEITTELQTIVEYLHQHLSSEVPLLALQVGYLQAASGEQYLLTETFGANLRLKQPSKRRPGRLQPREHGGPRLTLRRPSTQSAIRKNALW